MSKSIGLALEMIHHLLQEEQKAGRVNSLANIAESQGRRSRIESYWHSIQSDLATIDQQIKRLPALPPEEHILWAQAVLSLRNLAFLELDTTGLDAEDEIIRFTLINSAFTPIEDLLIKPTTRRFSDGASRVNGIRPEQLEREGLPIKEAWERIQAALSGHYIVSYSQKWDVQQLKAATTRHTLEPVMVIGDDLQLHTFQYYHREYNLTLATICERIGHPLPEYPHQTSLDRAKGQVHVMIALANAVTDVRPEKAAAQAERVDIDFDLDGMVDLESHPF